MKKIRDGYYKCDLCGYTYPTKKQREFIAECLEFMESRNEVLGNPNAKR
jgi:hypothetical protein